MATPATLGQEHQKELQQATAEVQQDVVEIKRDVQKLPDQLPQKIKEAINTAKTALTDYSGSISSEAPGFLLKVIFFDFSFIKPIFLFQSHLWSAACLAGFFAGEMAGKSVFHALTEGVLGSWASLVVLGLIVPTLAWGAYLMFGNTEKEKGNVVSFLSHFLIRSITFFVLAAPALVAGVGRFGRIRDDEPRLELLGTASRHPAHERRPVRLQRRNVARFGHRSPRLRGKSFFFETFFIF